jgi:hypothetical protein
MTTHRRIPPVAKHARTVPLESLPRAPQTDPLRQAARRILILALVFGSLGADAAASPVYASAGHVNSHQQASNIRLTASASSPAMRRPWMY